MTYCFIDNNSYYNRYYDCYKGHYYSYYDSTAIIKPEKEKKENNMKNFYKKLREICKTIEFKLTAKEYIRTLNNKCPIAVMYKLPSNEIFFSDFSNTEFNPETLDNILDAADECETPEGSVIRKKMLSIIFGE